MFSPKYTISNAVLKNIGVIDASKEMIESYHLSQTWRDRLIEDAQKDTIYYGLSLEGIKLAEGYFEENRENFDYPLEDQSVSNFLATLQVLKDTKLQFEEKENYFLTHDTLSNLHLSLTEGILPQDQTGKLRERQLAIKDARTLEIVYSPPPAAEVPYLIEDLINFLNSPEGKDLHPIIKAAIVHFEVYRIHPFSQFSTAVAIFLSLLLLYLDHYDIKEYLSFLEYFDATLVDYYRVIQSCARDVQKDTDERDLTPWIEYYTKGVTLKILELKEKIERFSKETVAKDHLGEKIELTERQVMILDYLKKHGSMRNKDFRKIFPDFSDDTVLREVKFLKKRGLVKKEGNTKKATYVLA